MKHRSALKRLWLASSAVLLTTHLAGCATARVREIDNCLPGVGPGSFICGDTKKGWEEIRKEGYSCFKTLDFIEYMKGCK